MIEVSNMKYYLGTIFCKRKKITRLIFAYDKDDAYKKLGRYAMNMGEGFEYKKLLIYQTII